MVESLKKQYKPCEPIVLSDMKWLKLNPGALRQAFKRMSDKGIVKRYMNGVYYFPDKGRMPTIEEVINGMYIGNRRRAFGYYSGYAFGRVLKVTERVDQCPVIVTNKENSRGRYRKVASEVVYLKKPYTDITRDNVDVMAVLDFMREWNTYSDLGEEETFIRIKEYLKERNIDKGALLDLAVYFPSKVSAILVKHKLV